MNTYYNLPEEVKYCKYCLMSNQRPNMCAEHYNTKDQKKEIIKFHGDVCDACKFRSKKKDIDWKKKEHEFKELLDKYRSKNGSYDVVVPGSGGKDSFYVAYQLKYKYNMNPITCTFAPHIYTPVGFNNFENWINSGFSNYKFSPDGDVHRIMTRLSLENILHPFQPWILGQKNFPTKFAELIKIPLIVYGENPAEYGNRHENITEDMNKEWFTCKDPSKIFLAGYPIKKLKQDLGFSEAQLEPYIPINEKKFDDANIKYISFSYYHDWHPQKNYYFTVENSKNFKTSSERSVGTYTTNASLDDKVDDLHYYTSYIKFGLGRVHYDVAQEIRLGDITYDEGKELINRYNGEYPDRWFDDLKEYLSINPNKHPNIRKFIENPTFNKEYFNNLCDKYRSPHLWEKKNNMFIPKFRIT